MTGTPDLPAATEEADRGTGSPRVTWIWRGEHLTRTGRLLIALTLLPVVIPVLYSALRWLDVEGPWGPFTIAVILLGIPAGIETWRWTRSPERR